MRGDLTVLKSAVTAGLNVADRFVLDGAKIVGTKSAGVGKRDSEKSFRVSLNAASVEAAGGEGLVRFVMSLDRTADGFRVYKIVPADGKPAHGKITVRA